MWGIFDQRGFPEYTTVKHNLKGMMHHISFWALHGLFEEDFHETILMSNLKEDAKHKTFAASPAVHPAFVEDLQRKLQDA